MEEAQRRDEGKGFFTQNFATISTQASSSSASQNSSLSSAKSSSSSSFLDIFKETKL